MSPTAEAKLFHSTIDLSSDVRSSIVSLLNAALADLTDLKSQTKYAHWNVKGPNFFSLHELFDKLAEGFDGQIDDVAERIAALGGIAYGTVRNAAANSSLDEFPEQLARDFEYVEVLAQRFTVAASAIRASIDRAGQLGDQGTADLLTGISRELDKNAWFLAAHLRK